MDNGFEILNSFISEPKGKKEILLLWFGKAMLFSEIIGQKEAKAKLVSLVKDNRLPHALMLHGPAGTGKLALAVALAQYLSCTDRQEGDACGRCPSCIKFTRLVHPDLHFVYPIVKTGNEKDVISETKAEQWREAFLEDFYITEESWYESLGAENKQGAISVKESESIISKLNFKPYESDYRMMVIWLPEKMNPSTANKLLKLIEEPPPDTHIIMVSEHTDRIINTILSRTQLLHIPPLEAADIRDGLIGRFEADPQLAEDAARRAGGDYSMALKTFREDEHELMYFELFTTLMRLAYGRKILEINDWVEQVATIGRERQKQLMDYSLRLIRENFMLHLEHENLNYMSSKEAEFSTRFSAFIHEGNVYELVEAFNLAGNHIAANGSPRLVFLDLGISVIKLLIRKPEAAG